MLLPLPEEEDWSFLASTKEQSDVFDPVKYVRLGSNGAYISFGGEGRFYFESFDNENFGQIPGTNRYSELRLLLHADLRLTPNVRFFVETQSAGIFGRRGGPRPEVDRDDLDLLEGFAEWHSTKLDRELHGPGFSLRVGRQQLDFGGGRLVSARGGPLGEGTNVLQGFDGIRAIGRHGPWRIDLFAAKPTDTRRGVFNDGWLRGQGIWGAYLTHGGAPGSRTPGVDVYYIGTTRPGAAFFAGTATETRQSTGVRAFRANTALAYDVEAVFQFGWFGNRDIRAWAATAETSYTFRDTPWSPQPGLRAGVDSGGASRTTLDTFYVPFPRGAYFGNLSAIGPENTTGVEGALTVHPLRGVSITGGAFVFWRKSVNDGLYGLPGYPLLPPVDRARTAGVQPVSLVTWKATNHLTFNAAYERFQRGDFIKSIPYTRSINYVAIWALFRF